jgi:hypothetical protein
VDIAEWDEVHASGSWLTNVLNFYKEQPMVRVQVDSSSLASVGYDPATETLEVEFTSGTVYQYSNVPAEVYEELMAAESHGAYFAQNIRNGGYRYRRVQ